MNKISLLVFLMASYGTQAAGIANGQVTDLVVNRFNHVIVAVENLNTDNLPACSTASQPRFALDITTEYG